MRTAQSIALVVTALAGLPAVLFDCSGSNSSNKQEDAGTGGTGNSSGVGNTSSGALPPSTGNVGGEDAGGGTSGVGPSSSGIVNAGGSSGSGDGGGSSSGGTTEGGASSSSSGGGANPDVPEGGMASNPGQVNCGSTTCSSASMQCCVSTADGGTDMCVADNATCASGITHQCKEAADCTSAVCCSPLLCGPHSSSCMTTCSGGNYQLCRLDSECGMNSDAGADAKKCIVQTCHSVPSTGGGFGGGTTCGGPTITVEACAYPSYGTGTGSSGGSGGGGTPGGGVPGGGVPGGGVPGGGVPGIAGGAGAPGGAGGAPTITWGALPGCTAN